MRALPTSVPAPQRPQLADNDTQRFADSVISSFATVGKLPVVQVVRQTSTGSPQTFTAAAPIGTWWVANATDYVRCKTLTLNGKTLVYQADVAGVSFDLVMLF